MERTGWGALFPNTNGLIAATRGEYCEYAVSSGGRFPSDTPDPVAVAFELMNLLQLESFVQEIHHEDRGAELL
nr:hypothetical protein C4D60_Mb05t27880 [Ipomoea batatas]